MNPLNPLGAATAYFIARVSFLFLNVKHLSLTFGDIYTLETHRGICINNPVSSD